MKQLKEDPQYEKEVGHTPESTLWEYLSRLEEKNEFTDDWQGKGSGRYILGGYFPGSNVKSANVANASWDRGYRLAYLDRRAAECVRPGNGASSAVRVLQSKT